jgi:hypothetical protein
MVCIGDVDFELLVCLDMRTSENTPSVISLSWKNKHQKWEQIASSISDFEKKVNLNGLNFFMKNNPPNTPTTK